MKPDLPENTEKNILIRIETVISEISSFFINGTKLNSTDTLKSKKKRNLYLTPSEEERSKETSIGTKDHRLEGVVETEVETTVDEDSDAGDDESTVETADSIGSEGLLVHIDKSVVLVFTGLALIISRLVCSGLGDSRFVFSKKRLKNVRKKSRNHDLQKCVPEWRFEISIPSLINQNFKLTTG